jgi:hypothetical protein
VGKGERKLGFGNFSSLYMRMGICGLLTGGPGIFVPGRAACRAGVVAQARARCTGRASPGTETNEPCHAWAGPKSRAFGRAAVLWAIWPSIHPAAQVHKCDPQQI